MPPQTPIKSLPEVDNCLGAPRNLLEIFAPPEENISRKNSLPANVIRPYRSIVYGRSLSSTDAIRMTNFDDINLQVAKHTNGPQVVHAKPDVCTPITLVKCTVYG